MSEIEIRDTVTPEELAHLYAAVGWEHKNDIERCRTAIQNTPHIIAAYDGEQLVGVARIATDRAFFAHLIDMVVHPDKQREGIGGILVDSMVDFCLRNGFEDSRGGLTLFSAKQVDRFYSIYNFKLVSNGMYYQFKHYRKDRKTTRVQKRV